MQRQDTITLIASAAVVKESTNKTLKYALAKLLPIYYDKSKLVYCQNKWPGEYQSLECIDLQYHDSIQCLIKLYADLFKVVRFDTIVTF